MRMRVLQIFFAYGIRDDGNVKGAEKELLSSLGKTYDLYLFLLLLIVALSDEARILSGRREGVTVGGKLIDLSRMLSNRFAGQLKVNVQLADFARAHGDFWLTEHRMFVRDILKKILGSELYDAYVTSEDGYGADRNFWYKALKRIIIEDADFVDLAERGSIYWSDAVDLAAGYAFGTIKRFKPESDGGHTLCPMFSQDDGSIFATTLLRHSILGMEDHRERITGTLKNWDIGRLSRIDLNILQVALAELLYFPTIPIAVTMSEYIDLARYFGAPKSPGFINGTLDAMVRELQSEGKLRKP